MHRKIKTWVARYLPAEICGTIFALLAAWLFYSLTKSRVVAAFAGTWGENFGYYGTIVVKDFHNKKHTLPEFFKKFGKIILEFGPAEILDSFIVRPFCLYFFPLALNQLALGILIGKIVADVIFYIPTILMYEFLHSKK